MGDNTFFCQTLADAFQQSGLPYPERKPEPGKLARFPTNGHPGDAAGWLKMFPDGAGAVFGCWREGTAFTWQERDENAPPPTAAERAAARAKAEAAKREAEAERAAGHAKGAKLAAKLWAETFAPDPAHPYLTKKGVKPAGSRLDTDGRLALPVYDAAGKIQSLQHIDARGEKRFLPGGKMQGGRLFLGTPTNGAPLVLAEGFATAASIRESTGMVAVIAFSGGNLKHVAADLARQFPKSRLIIAADLDAHGRGAEYAQAAANDCGGATVALPRFSDGRERGDYNDLHQAEGGGRRQAPD